MYFWSQDEAQGIKLSVILCKNHLLRQGPKAQSRVSQTDWRDRTLILTTLSESENYSSPRFCSLWILSIEGITYPNKPPQNRGIFTRHLYLSTNHCLPLRPELFRTVGPPMEYSFPSSNLSKPKKREQMKCPHFLPLLFYLFSVLQVKKDKVNERTINCSLHSLFFPM